MLIEDALVLLRTKALPGLCEIYGGAVDLIDEGIEEYGWGWVFYVGATSPTECGAPYCDVISAVILDRESGRFIDASLSTLRFEIEQFHQVLGRQIHRKDLIPVRQI